MSHREFSYFSVSPMAISLCSVHALISMTTSAFPISLRYSSPSSSFLHPPPLPLYRENRSHKTKQKPAHGKMYSCKRTSQAQRRFRAVWTGTSRTRVPESWSRKGGRQVLVGTYPWFLWTFCPLGQSIAGRGQRVLLKHGF